MAISNLVLTQQIYSEETNGAHAHYREPVPLIYCSIMLSRVKLTNAQTVRGKLTLKNNTECFRNGLVRELKERQRKLSRHSMASKTRGPHRRKDKSEYQECT